MARKTRTKPRSRARQLVTRHICRKCGALCCHMLVTCIEKPKDDDDIDYYKWHLHFDTVSIAIRHHRWYLVVQGRCVYLDDNNLCTIYDRRPAICRRLNPPHCERFGSWCDTMLNTPEELVAYLNSKKKSKKAEGKKRKCSA